MPINHKNYQKFLNEIEEVTEKEKKLKNKKTKIIIKSIGYTASGAAMGATFGAVISGGITAPIIIPITTTFGALKGAQIAALTKCEKWRKINQELKEIENSQNEPLTRNFKPSLPQM